METGYILASLVSMQFQPLSKSLARCGAVAIILGLTGCQALEPIFGPSVTTYTVKRVSDGDTMTVINADGTDVKLRLACVDAPEVPHSPREQTSQKMMDKSQFKWGRKAQQRVQQLVERGGDRVQITVTDTDQYGRRISEVRLPNGTLIQEVLAREGLAQVYRPYLKNCPSTAIVEAAEAQAKQKRRGLWRDDQYVAAWEWRQFNK